MMITTRLFHLLSLVLLLLLSSATTTTAVVVEEQECTADGTCTSETVVETVAKSEVVVCSNNHKECDHWASLGECDANPNFMLHNCLKACNVCHLNKAQITKKIDKISSDKEKDVDLTETPYGVKQQAENDKQREIVQNMTDYMEEVVFQDPGHAKVKKDCKNRNKLCAAWTLAGECEANPAFMTLQCAPSCQTCNMIDFDTRCPYNATEPTILNPGDLDKLFSRLTTEDYYVQKYQATIHSMPNNNNPTSAAADTNNIPDGPWVVTLENFMTNEECDRLIQLGSNEGYEVSMDVGPKKFDGSFDGFTNNRRTSTNAWCKDDCFNDTFVQSVLQKIENVTGVPDGNSEFLQLLRYEPGQFYKTHHDYIEHHSTRQEGVRILTVFLYLNDVEEGGGTDFPTLGITVQPKRGRVLIWPSVFNDNPNKKDKRTEHQALPVIKGIKYGANAWLHQRDFKTVFERSCH